MEIENLKFKSKKYPVHEINIFNSRYLNSEVIMPKFALRLSKRSSGRVARQRSAKPCTAVRIRSRPPKHPQKGCFFYSPKTKKALTEIGKRFLIKIILQLFFGLVHFFFQGRQGIQITQGRLLSSGTAI